MSHQTPHTSSVTAPDQPSTMVRGRRKAHRFSTGILAAGLIAVGGAMFSADSANAGRPGHGGRVNQAVERAVEHLDSNYLAATVAIESDGFDATPKVHYRTVEVDGQEIFYREAGSRNAPTVLLLHGFPTSSHMFRDLIPQLASQYHVVAPDYPGFGNSSMPLVDQFEYTFSNLTHIVEGFTEAIGLDRYSLYVMDYGAPVGYRLAVKHPERVQALIIQNGNAYEEGISDFWGPITAYWADRSEANAKPLREFLSIGGTQWQYVHGTKNPEIISPDNWNIDQRFLDRPGNKDIQLQLFYDYQTNVDQYPKWHAYFREHQPPALVVWGKNDEIFPAAGAHPYKRDLETVEFHLLDTGHFALEEEGDRIAFLMRDFLGRHVRSESDSAE